MKTFYCIFSLILGGLLFSPSAFAQTDSDYPDNLRYRKWRLTLVNPISTNGLKAPSYTARYSINVLGGYHGGLDGFEIGGLFNYNERYSNGVQIAGLVNATQGSMSGINVAGLVNFANNDMSGIQAAGIGNFTNSDLAGIQVAGLVNNSLGSISGIQVAGIANISNEYLEGLQFSSILNFAHNDLSGLQVSSGINIAQGDVEGLQISGLLSYAGRDISGLQISGFATVSRGNSEGLIMSTALNYGNRNASGLLLTGGLNVSRNLDGLMISGIGNTSKNMTGVQLSGIFNLANRAEGMQIAPFNFAREFNGLPIGLISLYGNGRKNIDLRYTDGGFAEYTFTTGTYRVYNMAILGYNTALDRDVFRVGIGAGLERNIVDVYPRLDFPSVFINQELSLVHNFEDKWDRKTNMILSYRFLVGKRFGSGVSIYGGPSFNTQITRVAAANDYTWYSLWSPEWKGRQYRFWVGFTAGIRLFKQKRVPNLDKNWDIDYEW